MNPQGLISKSVNNVNTMFDSLGYITTNVSNYNTAGYKAQRFECYMKEFGLLEGTVRTNYSQGDLLNTDNQFDIGIQGVGFIPVTKKDGSTAYTRDGSFGVNKDGYLVTKDGSLVGDGIKIPANYEKIKISTDGTVNIISSTSSEPEKVGKIPLVTFNNPEELKSVEGDCMVPTEKTGKPLLLSDHSSIKQGCIERSNVNMYDTVNEVLRLNGSLISSTRLIKAVDEMYRQSINLRQ
ncbi:MAG: flagellar hook basal-body protein [Candidatus Gastranaerophilales bacterium]|nr:flagellar hook basal-body protein [Candidatus Gastranaerophilales bacterium]